MTTVKDAFAGLPNVIPNSGKEEKQYTGTESDYSLLLKNDAISAARQFISDRRMLNHEWNA